GISPTAVGECVRRARRACLSWPLPASLDDETLENRLYPPPAITSKNKRPQPDWPDPSRAEAAGGDAATHLGGASRPAPRWLWVQPVLRSLYGLGETTIPDHAADARGR